MSEKTRKRIENVKLIEIRKEDKAQHYIWIGGEIWLTGWNRAKNVQVGDTGYLEYRSSPSCGLWWFEKYQHPITEYKGQQ